MEKKRCVVHDPIIVDKVRELRRVGFSYRKIGDFIGISESSVSRICNLHIDVPNPNATDLTVISLNSAVIRCAKDHTIMISRDMTDDEFWTCARELYELYQSIKGEV